MVDVLSGFYYSTVCLLPKCNALPCLYRRLSWNILVEMLLKPNYVIKAKFKH